MRLCCFLPPCWNTLRFTQATLKAIVTHNNFQLCHMSFSLFVRQPFSKQLYMLGCALDPSLHMLGRALHSGLYNKVASVHVQHGVVCCSITSSHAQTRLPGHLATNVCGSGYGGRFEFFLTTLHPFAHVLLLQNWVWSYSTVLKIRSKAKIVCHKQTVMIRVAGDIQSSSRRNPGSRQLVLKPLCVRYLLSGR